MKNDVHETLLSTATVVPLGIEPCRISNPSVLMKYFNSTNVTTENQAELLHLTSDLCPGAVSVGGGGGNHGEAVAVCDGGSFHGSASSDLPQTLRVSDPVTQPGNPVCQERPPLRAPQHRQTHRGAAAGRQLRDQVRTKSNVCHLLM